MVNNMVLAAGCVILACGGLAFALAAGDSRADKRRAAFKKGEAKSSPATVDRAAKKKQIAENIKELEKKSRRKRADLQTRIEQAGLSISRQRFLIIFAAIALALGGLAYFKSESLPLAGLVVAMSGLGLPNLVLARLRARRINKFVAMFPNALDIIVRGV